VRLLLDEHYSDQIAQQLRARGHDVVAVSKRPWRGEHDEALLEIAVRERRALLTNNVRDFVAIARRWSEGGQEHYGLIFTSDARMPRNSRSLGLYVRVLGRLLEQHPADAALANQVRWLP
jgi:predicted nuclease of predicted toxin-antitoxin system